MLIGNDDVSEIQMSDPCIGWTHAFYEGNVFLVSEHDVGGCLYVMCICLLCLRAWFVACICVFLCLYFVCFSCDVYLLHAVLKGI